MCVLMQMMGNKQDRGCVLLMSKDRRDKYKKYRNIFNWRDKEKDIKQIYPCDNFKVTYYILRRKKYGNIFFLFPLYMFPIFQDNNQMLWMRKESASCINNKSLCKLAEWFSNRILFTKNAYCQSIDAYTNAD